MVGKPGCSAVGADVTPLRMFHPNDDCAKLPPRRRYRATGCGTRSSMQRRMRTELDLDRHVAETSQAPQAALVGRRRQRMVGNDGYYRSAMAGTDLPQMQVGDPVTPGLQ